MKSFFALIIDEYSGGLIWNPLINPVVYKLIFAKINLSLVTTLLQLISNLCATS
ncbi:MAG: hypothetical protein HEQ13_22030 [Dolichospermum sp. DEX189]|nr:hypothetical protein [Dolichospermum sp. DEX189]